jgi:hypothetical protein
MRSDFAPAIAIAMIMPATLSARSDDVPTLDLRPVCRGIASQSGLEAGLQRTPLLRQQTRVIALPWLRQEENRVTPSSSPVWKWREMCGP